MLSLLIICCIAGGVGAILQGMLGIGTGVIIVPLLTFILPKYGISSEMAIHVALATSMAAIATNSVSALISHHAHGNIQWPLFKKIILFSIAGSCVGALLASHTPAPYLRAIFGIFLLLTAIFMLFKKQSNEEVDTLPHLSLVKIAAGGFSIGAVASIIGSGGGILMVPFLHSLKLKMRYVIGTSTLIGFPVAVMGAVTYMFAGLGKISSFSTIGYVHWPAFLAITAAGILCVPWGVKLTTILPAVHLRRLFAILLIIVSIKMMVSS